jgi:hypothetical protein
MAHTAGTQRVRVPNRSARGMYAYVEVSLGPAQNASYALALAARPSP